LLDLTLALDQAMGSSIRHIEDQSMTGTQVTFTIDPGLSRRRCRRAQIGGRSNACQPFVQYPRPFGIVAADLAAQPTRNRAAGPFPAAAGARRAAPAPRSLNDGRSADSRARS